MSDWVPYAAVVCVTAAAVGAYCLAWFALSGREEDGCGDWDWVWEDEEA